MAENYKEINTWEDHEEFLKSLKGGAFMMTFSDEDPKSQQVDEVVMELAPILLQAHIPSIKVKCVNRLKDLYGVEMIPTVIIMQDKKEYSRVEGVDPRKLKKMLDAFVQQKEEDKADGDRLLTRLQSLVKQEKVMVFLKGSADKPFCGFSKKVIAILKSKNLKFGSFDILKDEEVRQGLKEFSKWPTYPQVYVDGELLGGVDVIAEMEADGDLDEALGI